MRAHKCELPAKGWPVKLATLKRLIYQPLTGNSYLMQNLDSCAYSFHSSGSGLQLAYTVDWKDPWEPFYIGPNGVPRYDERFKQACIRVFKRLLETIHTLPLE